MKYLRNEGRRGVSPVIATLLLIVIAVAAAVLVYMWTVGYATQMKPTTPETGERLKIEGEKLFRESTLSRDVNATLYIRNVGGSPVYINGSYLLTTAGSIVNMTDTRLIYVVDVATGRSWSAAQVALNASKVYMVKIRFAGTWPSVTPGVTYIVKIVTALGNEFPREVKLLPTP
jgi:flagellin-like protein